MTLFTASGTSQLLFLPAAIVGGVATDLRVLWLVPDAVNIVICAPDDGRRNHPKDVEQFTDNINRV